MNALILAALLAVPHSRAADYVPTQAQIDLYEGMKTSDPDTVIKHMTLALESPELRPQDRPVALINRAEAYKRKYEADRALADFSAYLVLKQDYHRPYLARAELLSAKGQHAKAVADFDAALKLMPSSEEARAGRELALKQLNAPRAPLAAQAPAPVAAAKPGVAPPAAATPVPEALAGEAANKAGRYEDALRHYTAAITVRSDGAHYRGRGKALIGLNRLDEAASDFDKALKAEPENAHNWHNRGMMRLLKKDFGGAVLDFSEALKRDSRIVQAYYARGDAQRELNSVQRALDDYRAAARMGHAHAPARVAEMERLQRDMAGPGSDAGGVNNSRRPYVNESANRLSETLKRQNTENCAAYSTGRDRTCIRYK